MNQRLLKNGENINSQNITLFCFPFAGGGASAYNSWVQKMKDPDLWWRYILSVCGFITDRQLCFRQLIWFCRKDMENTGADNRKFQAGYRCI